MSKGKAKKRKKKEEDGISVGTLGSTSESEIDLENTSIISNRIRHDNYDTYKIPNYKRTYPESGVSEYIVFLSSSKENTPIGEHDRMAISQAIRKHSVNGVKHLKLINKYKVGVVFDVCNNANVFIQNEKFFEELNLRCTIPASATEITGILKNVPVNLGNKKIYSIIASRRHVIQVRRIMRRSRLEDGRFSLQPTSVVAVTFAATQLPEHIFLDNWRHEVFTPGVYKKPYKKSSKIKQIQLEQDSGKSLHDTELKRSLVDLNRAGAPLIELVFEPDLQDGEEAAALVKELILIVQRLGACSGRMEEGALRVDANVSIHEPGTPLATRTEIKNIGSIRGVAGAIKHEIERQRAIVESGGRVTNETRSWDATNRVTVAMRDKETVQDYRYMPEPNLPPLRVNLKTKEDTNDIISVPLILEKLPELPEESRSHLIEDFHLRPEAAVQLVNEPILLEYFEELTSNKARDPSKVANLLTNDLLTVLNKRRVNIEECPITTSQLKELTDLLLNKEINLEICKNVLDALVESADSGSMPSAIVKEKGWTLVTDRVQITKLCKEVLENNPKLVKQYKEGKLKVFKAMLGILAKNTQNKVDMSLASKEMEVLLKSDK